MSEHVLAVNPVEGQPRAVIQVRKPVLQFLFGTKGLDYSQSAKCLLDLHQQFGRLLLTFGGAFLQRAPDQAYQPSGGGQENEHKERQLPAEAEQDDQIDDNHYRVLEQHVQRCHNTGFHLVDIRGHAGHDVAFACLGEIAHRQRHHLVVQLSAQIPEYASPNGDHKERGKVGAQTFEACHRHQEQPQQEEHPSGSVGGNLLTKPPEQVVFQRLGQ